MKTVGDAAEFLSGGTPKKSTEAFWNGEIPWFSASNMYEKFLAASNLNITEQGLRAGSRMAPSGATLLLVRGSGLFNHIPICFADRDVAFNQDVKAIVAKDGVDPLYLHYTLEAHRRELESNLGVTGIGAGKFDTDFLKQLSFVHRDRGEQEEIGRLASAYDRKIELNRRMNETLEEMARALFRDWFVDFGPTRRQIEGATDPAAIMGHAFPPKKAATLAPLFPAKLGDDGLPEGWDMETLGDFAERSGGSIQTGPFGSQLHKSDYVDSGVPVLMPANLTYSQIKPDGIAYVTEEKATSLAKHRCKPGDIIYGRRGDIGRKALISDAQNGWFCGTGCLKVSIHSAERSPNVLFMQIDSENAVRWIRSRAIGATMPNLNTKTLGGLPILKIGFELSAPFTEIVGPLEDRRQQNEQENQTLAEMRDLLLPKLMSGEIRLKDAEAVRETKAAQSGVVFATDMFGEQALTPEQVSEREVVMVAANIHALKSDEPLVGNVRLMKANYLIHRKMGWSTSEFERRAAGPHCKRFNDEVRRLAQEHGWIRAKSSSNKEGKQYRGSIPATSFSEIEPKIKAYGLAEAIDWLSQHFKGAKRGWLECVATVDDAMQALARQGAEISVKSVKANIAATPNWKAKLEKAHFEDSEIDKAIRKINQIF